MHRTKPITYPLVIAAGNPRVACGTAAVMALAALAGSGWALLTAPPEGTFWFGLLLAALAGVVALFSANGAVRRTVIMPGQISKSDIFGTRTLVKTAILGRRTGDLAQIRLITAEGRVLSIPAAALYRAKAWFGDVRDLDAEDKAARRVALDNDPRLGSNLQARRRRLARLRRLVDRARWPLFGIYAWALFWPRPYLLVIALLALLPVVVFVVQRRSGGLLSLTAAKDDPRPRLDTVLLTPPLFLGFRALLDFQFLDWQALFIATALIGLAVTVAVHRLWPEFGRGGLTAVCLFAWCWYYAFGVVAVIDVRGDGGRPTIYSTSVQRLHVAKRSRSKTYEVTVGAWGMGRHEDTFNVGPAFYNSLRQGDPLCVYIGRGALELRWIELNRC